ncbi:MAG TPA: hypothetical protein VF006_03175 [Longimicrobium sp.]
MHTWLYTGRLALLAAALACAPLGAQQQATAPAPPPAANPADVASPEAIVTALYDVISGPAAQARDWNRMRSLYRPDARLSLVQRGPAGQERLHSLGVEDFIRLVGPGYQTGAGFWERELGHRIDRFGSVAHVFSAYETRRAAADGPVAERGINSIQLVHYEGRWWVTNLVFDGETPANPIPPEYLAPANQ